MFLLLSSGALAFRQVSVCVHACGQVAFVLSPQACIQLSVTRVELIQVTNAPRGETLFTVATQCSTNNPRFESSQGLNPREMDPLTWIKPPLLKRRQRLDMLLTSASQRCQWERNCDQNLTPSRYDNLSTTFSR